MQLQKLLIFGLLGIIYNSAISQFSGGTGTINDPYQITSASEFNQIRNYLSASFILLNDIDLTYDTQDPGGLFYNSGEGWEPISSSSITGFGGRLNGNGHKITGVFIDRGPVNQDYVGLFGNIKGGEVSNLTLEDFSIMGNNYVGGLAGLSSGAITDCAIINSSIDGSVSGGLVGDLDEGGILRCKVINVDIDVDGSFTHGGVAGRSQSGAIQNSYAIVIVGGSSTLGGIVGHNTGIVENCYALGTVDGNNQVGGVVGHNDVAGVVRYSYSTAAISGSLSDVGGVAGKNSGTIQNSYWNTEESGIGTSAGGTPLTSSELSTSSSFTNWDFSDTWNIFDSQTYPFLRVFSEDSIPGLRKFLGGTGSSGDPFEIATAISLSYVREFPTAHFILMNDLDLSDDSNTSGGHFWNDGSGWEPIGTMASPFSGNFNGQGYTISGLFIDRSAEDDIGLFGVTAATATVQELNLASVDIKGGSNVGALVGKNVGGFESCSSTGMVLGSYSTGGLAGTNSGLLMNSYTSVETSGGSTTGGFVGFNEGSIMFSYATGDVNGTDKTGGFVGENGSSASLDDCYATGEVSGGDIVGGFVGSVLSGSSVTYCYSIGGVTGTSIVGGFIGSSDGTVTDSFWNTEASCLSSSDGGEGKSNTAFQQEGTFVDWDFSTIWMIDEGSSYPYHLWQGSSNVQNMPEVIANPVPVVGTLADLIGECSIEEPAAPKAITSCGLEVDGIADIIFPIDDQGTTMITWTYEDAFGNQSTQEQKIIITDMTAPTPDEVSLPDLTGECSIAEPTAPVATDNCGESITGVADMTFPITTQGTTVITWSFEDQQGNISTQTQNAIIDDTTDPIPDVATLPDLNGFCEVLAPTSPTATDNCEGAIEGQANVTFPVTAAGTTVITWTYDDGNGNMATQTQNVIIEDDAAPVPDETTLPDLNGECSLSMPAAPTATDNCDGVISGVTVASFPITESTTITWTYTDASGNSVEQTQEVIIEDVTPPVPNSSTLATLSGECVVVRPSAPKATDNCGGVITGTTTTQQLITESTTIIWTYTDPSGNFSTQDQEVVITDETAPFPDRLNLPDLVGECLVNNPGVPTALDNCDGTIQAT
ncbi:MAG: GLUG motif-containing protein, partial [Cyclobacteriaceae bacterium]